MKHPYQYGIVSGAGLCCWVLIEYALGFHTTSLEIGQYSGYFSFIIPAAVIYAALKESEKKSPNIFPLKEGINTGFHIAFVSAVIFTVFISVYNSQINPGWIDAMVEWQRKKLILGGASNDEIERFMDQHRTINSTAAQVINSFVSTTGIGVFITLAELFFMRIFRKSSGPK